MALTKKYKCMNIGGCKNANEKKVFEIPVGEELVCPVCGAKMLVEVKSIPWVKYACIAGAVVVLVVGAVVLIPRLGDKPTPPPPGGGVDTVTVDTLTQTTSGQAPEDTTVKVISEEPEGKGGVEVQTPPDPEARVVIDLGYGTYTGKVKDGKPHDPNGTIVYKKAHQIESRDVHGRVAQPGDRVTGNFENGHLINGTWHKSDGNQEQLMIGG